jgi:predicted RNA-binding Zn-ribbon protein involved in translation (DUF1610 family)
MTGKEKELMESDELNIQSRAALRRAKLWIKCPQCGSRDNRYRALDENYRCRRCPAVYIVDEVKKEVNLIIQQEV